MRFFRVKLPEQVGNPVGDVEARRDVEADHGE
jgi:hypothetical protein